MDQTPKSGYLMVACNGTHGVDGARVALRVDGHDVGAPEPAPSYPDMVSKSCEVMMLDPQHAHFTPEIRQISGPDPYQKQTLILSEWTRGKLPRRADLYFSCLTKEKFN